MHGRVRVRSYLGVAHRLPFQQTKQGDRAVTGTDVARDPSPLAGDIRYTLRYIPSIYIGLEGPVLT